MLGIGKVTKLQEQLDFITTNYINYVAMQIKPQVLVARQRKNGRHEIQGKRYSIKATTFKKLGEIK